MLGSMLVRYFLRLLQVAGGIICIFGLIALLTGDYERGALSLVYACIIGGGAIASFARKGAHRLLYWESHQL